jgi:tripartite-type tricarboxylate transporter receptor subunit TctC
MIDGGKLRALAVTSDKRIALLPDTPTVSETVLPGFSAAIWTGMLAPKGTPAPVVERLYREFNTAMGLPSVQDRLKGMASTPMDAGPAAFGDFLAGETRRWGGVIRQLGLKP